MKYIYAIIVSVLLSSMASAQNTCTFYAFEINGDAKIDEFENTWNKNNGIFSKKEFGVFTNLVDKLIRYDVKIVDNKIICSDRYRLQYLVIGNDGYSLIRSDHTVGLDCDLTLDPLKSGGFMIRGKGKYHAIAERMIFKAMPEVDGGRPVRVMGGSFENGIMLPAKKIATLTDFVIKKPRSGKKSISGMMLVIDRNTTLENDEGFEKLF